jgi:hypothetical protein
MQGFTNEPDNTRRKETESIVDNTWLESFSQISLDLDPINQVDDSKIAHIPEVILGYFITLLKSVLSYANLTAQNQQLAAQLRQQKWSLDALDVLRPLSDYVRRACLVLAGKFEQIGDSPTEVGLRVLLGDAAFQNDFVEWLQAGGIQEGDAVKARLLL